MILRCRADFETREPSGVPFTIREGTVWQRTRYEYAMGGYELAVLEEIRDGAYTGNQCTVRAERLLDDTFDDVPPTQCSVPIGCAVPDANG